MFARKESKQFEFFEEFTKSPTKRFKRFRLPSIGEEKIILKISYERIVLVSIGLVLILTLVFSLGVERGKSLMEPKAQQKPISVVKIPEENISTKDFQEAEDSNIKSEFYTIQVVAYKNVDRAKKEKQVLEKQGFKSYILKRKSYFQVCAGNFDDLSLAKKKLMSLSKDYRGCFIRKVKQEDLYNE